MLSVFLITLNEGRNLGECLASVRGLADEIIVLDSSSTDDTVAIARAAGARVENRDFDDFGRQKQAALDLTRGDWVLSIDADERLTPALAEEIREVLRAPAADGYEIRRQLTYLGHDMRFGGTERDWVLRLARRARARFTPVPVHERLEVDGRVARLRAPMRHVKYRTLSEHLATIDRYTTLIAQGKRARGKRFYPWHLLRFPLEIFSRLILRLGILDGRAGVIHAAMAAFYAFLKYAKLWPEKDAGSAPSHTPGAHP